MTVELDGILWVGGLNDRALREYQGTRAGRELRGLPVVRTPAIGPSAREAFQKLLPEDWNTVMVLYEGFLWRDKPEIEALKIELAVNVYTDHDVIFFDDPKNREPVGGFIVRLCTYRAKEGRRPRVSAFEPSLMHHPADPIADAVAEVLAAPRVLH